MSRHTEAGQLATAARELIEAAIVEGRELSDPERERVDALLASAEMLKSIGNAPNVPPLGISIEQLGRQLGASYSATPGNWGPSDPGSVFTSSEAFKSLFGPGVRRGERWATGPIEVTSGSPYMLKGTLSEGASGGGGALIPVPQLVPGLVQKLFQPLSIEACLSSGIATGNSVRYVVQGTATSGAAGVAELGLKPESVLGFNTADESIKKIATIIGVSEELLDDQPSVQTLINGQLISFVNIEAERQLLRGTSGGNEVQGLLTSRSVPVYNGGTAAGNKAEQLFKGMNSMRGSALMEPEWVIVHPTDYEAIRLLKDSNNQLYGGGPFFGPYGNSTVAGASGQVSGAIDMLWSKPVYVTAAIGAGTALTGAAAAAAVWNRGGLSVEASNSHDDWFAYDKIAIRAERRLGLTVYRANGFVEIRLA